MARICKGAAAVVLAAAVLAGCTTKIGDLTFISTKNIDVAGAKLDAGSGQRVKAEDCEISFLGVPFNFPDIEKAVDKALAKGHGDVMVDVVSRTRYTWFLLGYRNCIEVEGTVLSTKAAQ